MRDQQLSTEVLSFVISLWGTVDAEIEALTAENLEV